MAFKNNLKYNCKYIIKWQSFPKNGLILPFSDNFVFFCFAIGGGGGGGGGGVGRQKVQTGVSLSQYFLKKP